MTNETSTSRKLLKVIMISLVIILFLANLLSYKNRVFRIVKDNIDILNNSIESLSYDDAYKIKGVKNISKYRTSNQTILIDYYCYGSGLVPSSVYYGFYYSGDGEPAGFQGIDYELIKEGNGRAWSQQDGDNWYYTEQILNNWYYYKAGF